MRSRRSGEGSPDVPPPTPEDERALKIVILALGALPVIGLGGLAGMAALIDSCAGADEPTGTLNNPGTEQIVDYVPQPTITDGLTINMNAPTTGAGQRPVDPTQHP